MISVGVLRQAGRAPPLLSAPGQVASAEGQTPVAQDNTGQWRFSATSVLSAHSVAVPFVLGLGTSEWLLASPDFQQLPGGTPGVALSWLLSSQHLNAPGQGGTEGCLCATLEQAAPAVPPGPGGGQVTSSAACC